MEFLYAAVPEERAQNIANAKYRKRDKKGNVILNQSDLSTFGGMDDTFEEKVSKLGGKVLTDSEAKKQLGIK
jgi:hypothetical protein